MRLNCVNIATTNLSKMRDFYSLVLAAPYEELNPHRIEILVHDVKIVLTHTEIKTPVNPDCCGLEFVVYNVDNEYERLLAQGVKVENKPVTYPWGWRAVGLKDPDGNHIDFVQNLNE